MVTLSQRQVAAMIKVSPGPWNTKREQVIAVAIFPPESGGRTTVYNHICCYGLWQINLSAHRSKIPGRTDAQKIAYLKTAVGNMKIAQKVYSEAGGWTPWQVYTEGTYKAHLAGAVKAVGGVSSSDAQAIYASIPGDPPGDWPTPSDPFGPFGDGLPDIPGTDAIGSALSAIANAFSWVADPHNWLRIATFIAGGALVLVVGQALLRRSDTGQQALQVIGMVASRGKSAAAGAASKAKGVGKTVAEAE